jgi:N-acetylglucosaminyldiphosphoundecaprenol N-acetyl-beta-D-mannosaminyltransferase
MSMHGEYRTVNILGVKVFALRMAEVLDICDEHITQRKPLLLGVVNAAKLVSCQRNSELLKSLEEANLVLADGQSVVWLSRMMGESLPERVAGIDLMYGLLEKATERSYGVYFLGARPEVVAKVVEVVQERYPSVRISGYRDGYFAEEEERTVMENIRDSSADIVFVAMPSPRKENFLRRWRSDMKVPLCHGVGGSFDVIAGITRRAPLWMQRCGLEWLYRLAQEPGRMWKRYLMTNTMFLVLGLRAIVKTRLKQLRGRSA